MRTRFPTLLKRAARPSEPDAELVRRFAASGDQAAFAELVRRYGRLVWGQCRNLLPNDTDADDAFQATFLTLAKSAKSVRQADRLGPWLHGVAYRVCQNAKRLAARRKKRERGSAAKEAVRPVADSAWDSALAAVHDELHKLPEPLRAAFVLCCLEGKGVSEAAGQLGLKLGTFSARLTRAKQALLDRLAARGLTAGVVALAAVTGGAATAPAKVVDRTIELVTVLAAGSAAVPANILSLTHGVLTMGTWNVKLLAAAVLVAGGLTAGFGGAFTAHAQDAPKERTAKDDKDRVIEDLKRALGNRTKQAQAEAAKDAANHQLENQKLLLELRAKQLAEQLGNDHPQMKEVAAQIELVKAEQERTKTKEAPAKKSQSEFKYFGQAANFAPTPDELEALVQRGEAGGYKFVGITNMKGTGKGDGVVPTLVFRKSKVMDLRVDGVLDEIPLKKLEGLDLNKVKPGLNLDLRGLELKKNLMLDDVKKMAEAQAKVAEAKAKEAELKAKEKVKEKLDAELKEKTKEKGPLPKQPADPAAAEKARYQAEIDALRAAIAELEGKTAKKPAARTLTEVSFTPDEFGKTGLKDAGTLLSLLAVSKYGDDPKAKVNVTVYPDKVVVSGDPEVVKWLQDAVKQLKGAGKAK